MINSHPPVREFPAEMRIPIAWALLVLPTLLSCQGGARPEWDDVDEATRQRRRALHAELQPLLAEDPGPRRQRLLAELQGEYEDLLRVSPRYFRARRDLQDLLAEVDFEQASQRYSRFQDFEEPGGLCLAARWLPEEDSDVQRTLYRRARSMDPEFVWADHGEALAEARDEQWGDAITLLDHALEVDPEFLEAVALRARVLEMAGRADEAQEAYGRELELDATRVEARFRRAHLMLESDSSRAAREARRELEWVLRDPEALGDLAGPAALDLGVALARDGRGAEALSQFERARSLGANALDVQYNKGWVLEEQLDRPEEALEAYREYLRLAKDGDEELRPLQILDSLFHVRTRVRNLEERLSGGRS